MFRRPLKEVSTTYLIGHAFCGKPLKVVSTTYLLGNAVHDILDWKRFLWKASQGGLHDILDWKRFLQGPPRRPSCSFFQNEGFYVLSRCFLWWFFLVDPSSCNLHEGSLVYIYIYIYMDTYMYTYIYIYIPQTKTSVKVGVLIFFSNSLVFQDCWLSGA